MRDLQRKPDHNMPASLHQVPTTPALQTHVVLAIITHAIEYEYICTVSIFLS